MTKMLKAGLVAAAMAGVMACGKKDNDDAAAPVDSTATTTTTTTPAPMATDTGMAATGTMPMDSTAAGTAGAPAAGTTGATGPDTLIKVDSMKNKP